ncbi:ASCH domain-containing protein [Pricia sp. S334]|uniref:ASCH domain-containing protein n=1 Tax=Pricia mediterranea TaxID=3076079 RepID=A0ABU3L607_9FLAO|nr:ASCH domain-containing protein [Pricia sp. S334]MDT7829102.1 ASCH domain-containing protein [Pricia sp. S334]
MENKSARALWGDYLDKHLEHVFVNAPRTIHFSNNEKDANDYAVLVKKGIKKATSMSLLGLQHRGEPLPKIGDFLVVTDWEGRAQCLVRTTKVTLKPFFAIDVTYALKEGIGDKSLAHWKKVHWDFFADELQRFGREPRESMIVVCQEFEKVS